MCVCVCERERERERERACERVSAPGKIYEFRLGSNIFCFICTGISSVSSVKETISTELVS